MKDQNYKLWPWTDWKRKNENMELNISIKSNLKFILNFHFKLNKKGISNWNKNDISSLL